MTTDENEALARRMQQDVWNEGNLDAIDELLAEDFVQHSTWEPSNIRGREEFKLQVADFHDAFPDLEGTVDEVIADGDRVANRFTMRGTHEGEFMDIEPTGNAVELKGTIFAHVEDGKITERWVVDDILGFLQQLGEIPDR